MSISEHIKRENARPVTLKQWAALLRVCEYQNTTPPDPDDYYLDETQADTIGICVNGMFIGIEIDGYAHT